MLNEAGRREQEIAEVVSRWTGIPVDKMLEGERDKLLQHGRRAAQARGRPGRGACAAVANADAPGARRACRTRTGRSAASCSSGPTGVGKTELTQGAGRVPVR
jgi:ATP-dependent Clp protease ATP-binding subunit ClpB